MDVIMTLLTNITRDMELIKKTLERMNENVKFGTLVKKEEVKEIAIFRIQNFHNALPVPRSPVPLLEPWKETSRIFPLHYLVRKYTFNSYFIMN